MSLVGPIIPGWRDLQDLLIRIRGTLQNFAALAPDNQKVASVEGACWILTWVFKELTAFLSEWNIGAKISDLLAEYQSFHPDLIAACRCVPANESFPQSSVKGKERTLKRCQ